MTRTPLAALAACLLLPAVGVAQSRRPLGWDDFYRIETPGQVAISPDGRRVAFVRSILVEKENRAHSEVWLVTADGSGTPTRLTNPSSDASSPRWSPDGKLLAFTSRGMLPGADGGASTWFLCMDAPGEAFQLDHVDGPPHFDPTGHWIALLRPVPPDATRPTPPAPASDAERKITERFDGRIFDWMGYRFDRRGYLPDPRDPWATPSEEVFLVPAEGGDARQLTRSTASVSSPAWRPDGGALAFVADTHERDEHTYERADLWTVTLDGSVTRLTDDEYDYGAPAWSSDGRQIAVVGSQGLDVVIRGQWDHGAATDIFVFTADGKERRNATKDWDFVPGSPEWSPDGRWIYFTADMSGDTHLFRVHPEGGSVQQVTFGDGRVSSVSFSGDHSRIAYAMQTPTDPGNVYVSSADAEEGTRLTDLNAKLLAELDLASPEEITFQSRDGTEVEGWVLPPVGYTPEEARRWPMILDVHGGPHGSYGNEFSFERQMQAAQGYFVLYTNPRGSTGYGEKFLWGTWGSWGDEDYDDVMAGVDHVLAQYPADSTRLAVSGYSYGGFMTNWIITRTHRFAAAVSGAGISDWVSDYGTADIPRTKESEFFGPPWEKEGLEHLLASSPIVHAKGVTTPTLFVNGEYDARVPIEEAEQMYTALQKQGVPAEMVRYPQTYHGGWTPWRTLHRYWISMQWVDRWLKGKQAS